MARMRHASSFSTRMRKYSTTPSAPFPMMSGGGSVSSRFPSMRKIRNRVSLWIDGGRTARRL